MGRSLDSRIKETVLFQEDYDKTDKEAVPRELHPERFIELMDQYGARLLFNYWEYADPPASLGPDIEYHVWFQAERALIIMYYSRVPYYENSAYLRVSASSSSDSPMNIGDLKRLLGLRNRTKK